MKELSIQAVMLFFIVRPFIVYLLLDKGIGLSYRSSCMRQVERVRNKPMESITTVVYYIWATLLTLYYEYYFMTAWVVGELIVWVSIGVHGLLKVERLEAFRNES